MSTKTIESITLLPYRERVKLVQQRMQALEHPKYEQLPKPAKVAAAEKLLREWEQKNDEHIDAQRKAHRAKRAEIADALILGQMERAVELLRAVVA
jgi:glutamine synthetase adenylyltransferase